MRLRQDDAAAAAKPPRVIDDLEEIDGGVVADDDVAGARPHHVGDVGSERTGPLHPSLARPCPPALVPPAFCQQAPDPVRHVRRHGAHGIRVEMQTAGLGPCEPVCKAGEWIAPVEGPAGFQGVHRGEGGSCVIHGGAPQPLIAYLQFLYKNRSVADGDRQASDVALSPGSGTRLPQARWKVAELRVDAYSTAGTGIPIGRSRPPVRRWHHGDCLSVASRFDRRETMACRRPPGGG